MLKVILVTKVTHYMDVIQRHIYERCQRVNATVVRVNERINVYVIQNCSVEIST